MLICIPGILNGTQLAQFSDALQNAEWIDGNATSGEQSARAKCNEQLAEHSPLGRALGDVIQDSLGKNALFFSAALPHKVFPPLFNRYSGGGNFGAHVDNAIRQLKGTDFRIRTDLSATLFLSDPLSYDGGDLVIEDTFAQQAVKLAAGDMVVYPASSLHRVTPVTRGTRHAAFFWIQSMVRDDAARRILFELDQGIRKVDIGSETAADATLQLTGVYHNLLRRWSHL